MSDFTTRTIILIDEQRRKLAVAMVENAPLGIEVVARVPVKARKPDQNALYWAGPIRDLAAQVWVNGRQYSAETIHEYLKRELLPENDDPDLPRLVNNLLTYRKWDTDPAGERVLIGSTTQLSVYGFSQYMEMVYAWGADLGVSFHASPNDFAR